MRGERMGRTSNKDGKWKMKNGYSLEFFRHFYFALLAVNSAPG